MFTLIHYYCFHTIHKFWVAYYLFKFACKMAWRALIHDLSKYKADEMKGFMKVFGKSSKVKYGSEEYLQLEKEAASAIFLHHARNRHHPEFHRNGMKDMSAVDLIEMMCDWQAATRRHDNGNVFRSLRMNQSRFGYSDDEKLLLEKIVAEVVDKSYYENGASVSS